MSEEQPRISDNLFVQQEDSFTYLVSASAPGVLVCETRSWNQLISKGPRTRGLAWLAAFLMRAGVLIGPQAEVRALPATQLEPLTAWLSLTEACNLNCPYCYVRHTQGSMAPETAIQAVQAVFRSAQLHGYDWVRLKYAGGEPTLNISTLLAAQKEAERLAALFGICLESALLTNGVHLTPAMIEALAGHAIAVMVSLDGLGEIQDRSRPLAGGGSSYQHVEKSLQCLRGAGIEPFISVTLTEANLDGLPQLVSYLLERELHFSLNFYRPGGAPERMTPSPQRLIDSLRAAYGKIERRLPRYSLVGGLTDRANLLGPHPYTCQAGRSYLVIGVLGQVAACEMDLDRPLTSIASEDPLGDLRNHPSVLCNPPYWEKECRDCPFASRCAGGCPRLTHQQIGRYEARSPLCDIYRQILPEAARLEALRLLRYEMPIEVAD